MARPLTGAREVFRRLEERNQARDELRNRVQRMVGIDPPPPVSRGDGPHHRINLIARDEPTQNNTVYNIPGGASMQYTPSMSYTGTELQDFLEEYVGRPNTEETQRQLQQALVDGLTSEEPINLTNIRRGVFTEISERLASLGRQSGRSYSGLQQAQMYAQMTDHPVMYLDTEYSGLPSGRITEMYGRSARGRSYMNPMNEIYYSTLGGGVAANLGSISVQEVMEKGSEYWDNYQLDMHDYMKYMIGQITHEEYQKRSKIREIKDSQKVSNKDVKFVLEKEY